MIPLLRIEKPCEEPLEQMHNISGGKFCGLCSKKVIDLSGLSDMEIMEILHQNKGVKFCGMVFRHQLNRPLEVKTPIEKNVHSRKITFTKIAAGVVLTASIINSYPAQTNNFTQTEINISPVSKQKNEKENTGDGKYVISGKVLAKETGKPIVTVISLITLTKAYSAKTDANGEYILEVPAEIIQKENLLEFQPESIYYNRILTVFTKEKPLKNHTTILAENGFAREYGEISPIIPTERSLILLNGKKLSHKLFNKSFSIYYDQYDVHYIPKSYIRIFIQDENVEDLFITFVKQ
ncbi:hypothetical protein HNP38_002975 [Chryseobacterium defluvii]|uniref:Carboxypeptidase-like protein n=1 Tax=Chryseobacterium defluvii TaxID=160396 RepID=A0A840KDR8_9FLAO|nr:hypothetical protein [Chryseobacterium defluvii]MBB4807669.1 hypothetical protein [Chryseobacterium defluvii]